VADEPPVPKFQRFERVRVVELPYDPALSGRWGTILWCDAFNEMYLVYFPKNTYRTLMDGHFQSEGAFDPESAHLGTRLEFSFDIDMSDDMNWVEGTYRLPGKFWEVMIFGKQDVPALRDRPGEWPSGIAGTVFDVPREAKLNRQYVQQALAVAFGVDGWVEVQGPDSMVLR
jgi:hypothetical protein